MSSGQTHMAFFFLIFLSIVTIVYFGKLEVSYLELGVSFFVGVIYCLLPDVDTPASIIRRVFITLTGIVLIVSSLLLIKGTSNTTILAWVILFSGLFLVSLLFLHHRGFTHSVLFGIIVSIIWVPYSEFIAVVAFIGFLSHLIAD